MELLHRSKYAIIWQGLAEEVVPTLSKGSVDLLVTDPPYGQKWQSGWRQDTYATLEGDTGSLDVETVVGLCLPALKRRRHLYVFGPCDLTRLPVAKPVTLIWDKGRTGLGDNGSPWAPCHEPIQFATAHYSKAEMEQGRGGLSARLRQGSVIREMRLDGTKIRHPTEKPIALMRCLIESSSLAGEVVLDPFAGSGSTLVAAVLAGRRALGVELDKEYADMAVARVKQAEAVAASMEGL